MDKIIKEIKVETPLEEAFKKFLNDFGDWWPKEYTWSQDKLEGIWIDGKKNGLCTEIGPFGFRCDWGRVTELIENKKVALKWQIGPMREPVPNPDKASNITIDFNRNDDSSTIVTLEHWNFKNHGNGGAAYLKMMASDHGWDYILSCFEKHCQK